MNYFNILKKKKYLKYKKKYINLKSKYDDKNYDDKNYDDKNYYEKYKKYKNKYIILARQKNIKINKINNNNYKEKYIFYKKNYLKLKKGGSIIGTIGRYVKNFYYGDDRIETVHNKIGLNSNNNIIYFNINETIYIGNTECKITEIKKIETFQSHLLSDGNKNCFFCDNSIIENINTEGNTAIKKIDIKFVEIFNIFPINEDTGILIL